jgi:hypothetical protein
MTKGIDSTEFNRLLTALGEDIMLAHAHYQLYKDLNQSLHSHPYTASWSQHFWNLTVGAHFNVTRYTLCRIYDKGDKNLHLHGWLLTIKEHLYLFDEQEFRQRLQNNPDVNRLAQEPRKPDRASLEADIQSCSPDNQLVKTLIAHRNNYIAHKGAKNIVAGKKIGEAYPLTYEDLGTLLARAETILNKYSRLYAANTYSMESINSDDYQIIFEYVEEKIKENRPARSRRRKRDQT